jgi:phage terminase large subunit-like protein
MAGNVAVIRDAAENIKPVKDKSTGRIDGIVAAIMALGRAIAGVGTQWFNESNALEIG